MPEKNNLGYLSSSAHQQTGSCTKAKRTMFTPSSKHGAPIGAFATAIAPALPKNRQKNGGITPPLAKKNNY
jgi:hypothetical protein